MARVPEEERLCFSLQIRKFKLLQTNSENYSTRFVWRSQISRIKSRDMTFVRQKLERIHPISRQKSATQTSRLRNLKCCYFSWWYHKKLVYYLMIKFYIVIAVFTTWLDARFSNQEGNVTTWIQSFSESMDCLYFGKTYIGFD